MSAIPLSDLIRGLPVRGEADLHPDLATVEVTGIGHDSRRVTPGDLFVAIPGERFDGRDFAVEATASGAVAVLGRGEPPVGLGVPWLAADAPRDLLGPLAARVYRRPDREMTLVGVTGTNGKSTVAMLTSSVLGAAGRPAGLIGSLVYRFGDWSERAERTTPESSDLLRLLRRMRDEGAEAVAMEVSSHALALGRVRELRFDLAVFTNLSRDHLDFHRDLESYYAAKRQLFRQLEGHSTRAEGGGRRARAATAVVCVQDRFGRRLAKELSAELRAGPAEGEVPSGLLTYGDGGDVQIRDLELSERGTRFTAVTPRGEVAVVSKLLGRFNADNLLAVVAVAEALELPWTAVTRALAEHAPIPGRMEPVDRGQPFPVYVDYSHTPAALESALLALRELAGRKVILVFGCGGDRDPGKRQPMGRIAGELADLPILTSDNPRTEDPLSIIRSVETGLKASGNPSYRVMPDRREAIRRAVAVADSESAVLVAGKGDEEVQRIGTREERFLDREEIERALEERCGSQKLG